MLKAVSSITNAIGALNYKGTWNANTNTPALASGVGTKGDYYVVSVAGTTTLDGISNWGIGDWAVFNGSAWQRVEGGADLNGVNLSVTGTTTLSGLTASTALALNSNKEVVSVTNTGTGSNVLATSPSLVTPILGTPQSGNFSSGTFTWPTFNQNTTGSANSVKSNATTGLMQIAGPTAGQTRVVTIPDANATMARTDAAQSFTGDQTLSTGNLIQGTAAKGFNFSANSTAVGKTSTLLNWYEEGTFTPTLTGSSTNPTVTYSIQRGRYTRVGRLVTIECYVAWSAITGGSGNIQVAGFPYTIDSNTGASGGGAISYLDGFTFTAGRPAPGLLANANTTTASVMCMGSGVSTQFIPVASVAAGVIIFTFTYSV